MKEAGKDYNPETAKDLRPTPFSFTGHGEHFAFELQIPEYVLARLTSGVRDRLQDYMQGYAERVVTEGIRGGYAFSETGKRNMARDVGQHLKNYIWERFAETQQNAGNDCWQVAESLQKVRKF